MSQVPTPVSLSVRRSIRINFKFSFCQRLWDLTKRRDDIAVADMVADMVANMVADVVADMEVDMVADMEVDKVADMVADKKHKGVCKKEEKKGKQ